MLQKFTTELDFLTKSLKTKKAQAKLLKNPKNFEVKNRKETASEGDGLFSDCTRLVSISQSERSTYVPATYKAPNHPSNTVKCSTPRYSITFGRQVPRCPEVGGYSSAAVRQL